MRIEKSLSILAINGSERDGNTADILRHVAEFAAQRGVRVDIVQLREMDINPCGPCGNCNDRKTTCATLDDVPKVVEKMIAADGVIFASPVHGFGTASLMQMFIERAGVGYLRFDRPLTNKVAGVIAVARRYSHGEVWAQLIVNALLNRMIVVGSGFPSVIQALHRGEALLDVEGVTNVERMVDRMIDMIEVLVEHRQLTGDRMLATVDRNERVGLPLNELVAG